MNTTQLTYEVERLKKRIKALAALINTSDEEGQSPFFESVTDITDAQLKNRVLTDSVSATGTMTVSGQPLDGEIFTVGSTTYTFKDVPENPDDIEIGATVVDTRANIVTAVNSHNTGLMSAFVGTTSTLTADQDIGATGNSLVTTEEATNVSFSAATLTGGENATYRTPIVLLEIPNGKIATNVRIMAQLNFVTGYDEVEEYSFIVYREGFIEFAVELQDGHLDFSQVGEQSFEEVFSTSGEVNFDERILFSSAGYENVEGGDPLNQTRITIRYQLADKLT